MKLIPYSITIFSIGLLLSCNSAQLSNSEAKKIVNSKPDKYSSDTVQTAIGELIIPAPYSTESKTNRSDVVDWPEGGKPTAPEGFTVSKYAADFNSPRNTYIAPNGDIFVSEAKTILGKNEITILRDTNGDGQIDFRAEFLDGLHKPYGMLIVGDFFYVANTDGLYRYPYKEGQSSLDDVEGELIVELPAGGYNNHWTRNLITNKTKDKIFISVGSNSNCGEHGLDKEVRRANILVVDLDGKNEKIYANGLRNPVGMDWNPVNGELWAAVNERDELGDNLVPDYVTNVKEGGFYGWPYSYYGQIPDPRLEGKGKDLIKTAIVPDVPVGAHTASLGLTFYDKDQFPEKYKNGIFVGQHGSWNRARLSGYKVAFVPFKNGKPSGPPEDFLTGFIANIEKADVYGRPVDVTVTPSGDLLVNDDAGNTIWKVTYTGN